MPAKKTTKKASKPAVPEPQIGVDPIDPPAADLRKAFVESVVQKIRDSVTPLSAWPGAIPTESVDLEVAHSPTPPDPEPDPLDIDIDPPPIPPAKSRGVLRWVKNIHRSFGPEAHYVTGILCDEVGNEFPVLLTESDLEIVRERARGMESEIAAAPPLY